MLARRAEILLHIKPFLIIFHSSTSLDLKPITILSGALKVYRVYP